jgi:aquaporin SIP
LSYEGFAYFFSEFFILFHYKAFGWDFARGDHRTLEHMFVYWVAPIQAALFGIWCVKQFTKPQSSKALKTDETKSKPG